MKPFNCLFVGGVLDGQTRVLEDDKPIDVPRFAKNLPLIKSTYSIFPLTRNFPINAAIGVCIGDEYETSLQVAFDRLAEAYRQKVKDDRFANWAKGSEEKDKDRPF